MSSSDGPSSESASSFAEGLRFARTVVVTAVLGLTLLGGLNTWVNPFATFDRAEVLVNTPPASFYEVDRTIQMRWLERVARSTTASRWVLGTSRVLQGFDVCDRPDIQKLALNGLGHTEMTRILAAALPSVDGPKTLYVEVSLTGDEASLQTDAPRTSTRASLFGWQSTKLSLETLLVALEDGRVPKTAPVACRARRWRGPIVEGAAVGPMLERLRDEVSHPRRRIVLESLLDAVAAECSVHPHTVVFFAAPYFVPRTRVGELVSIIDPQAVQLQDLLEHYRRTHPACRFEFVDFATAAALNGPHDTGQSHPEWYNASHFTPEVGGRLLTQLLARSREP